jgi:AraC-like DNA-binding protein
MEPVPAAGCATSIPSGYAEHAPPADLRHCVECFWTRLSDAAARPAAREHRVLPDGATDILFEFDDGGGPGARGSGSMVGTMTRPLVVSDAGASLYVGVRFRPGYARMALGVPAVEVTDASVPLDGVARGGGEEVERVALQPTPGLKLEALVALVRQRVSRSGPPPRGVRAALRRIALAGGNLRVEALAQEIGVSRQHLARQFAEHAGVSPKVMARVVRVREALARAAAVRGSVDWGRMCYELGYYDQSHFIGEFRAIVGMNPGEWRLTRGDLRLRVAHRSPAVAREIPCVPAETRSRRPRCGGAPAGGPCRG